MNPLEDDFYGGTASSIGTLAEGTLARLQSEAPKVKQDWSTVPTPRPITDEKMQSMYAIIYHGFVAQYKLQRVEIPLFAIISAAAKSQRDGWCYMSQATLAKLCGVSVPTINDGLKRLETKGLLERGRWVRGATVHIRPSPMARKEQARYEAVIEVQRKKNKVWTPV